MDSCGIDLVVAQIRSIDRTETPEAKEKFKAINKNKMLADILMQHSDKVIGMAGIEPNDSVDFCLSEIQKYVVEGPATGINLEPGMSPKEMSFIDPKLYEIYSYCEKNNVPLSLSFGGLCSKNLENMNPLHIDKIARDFPRLHLILAHGGYPWVSQMCWIAQNRASVWLAPDLYIEAAGGSGYVEATKMWVPNKICFGSMYPAASLERVVNIYKNAGFSEKALELVMGENAAVALFLK